MRAPTRRVLFLLENRHTGESPGSTIYAHIGFRLSPE